MHTAAPFFLVGPTATGKSAVAQWIAEQHGYDILSADSMLVYEGMDIGTAKPSPKERERVDYYGVDLVQPDRPFSLGDFLRHATETLGRQAGGNKSTIVVGGTGLYVKGLLHGLDATTPSDPESRAKWETVLADEGVAGLRAALKRLSPAWLESMSDPSNPRRLVRALELASSGISGPPRDWNAKCPPSPIPGFMMPPEQLNRRIEERVRGMYADGLLDEAAALLERYGRLSQTAAQAIGYAEAFDVLSERCTQDEAIQRTVIRTRRLAKRQRTWFRHQLDVAWIDVEQTASVEHIAKRVLEHWRHYGGTEIAT